MNPFSFSRKLVKMPNKKLIKELTKASDKALKSLMKARISGDASKVAKHALRVHAYDTALLAAEIGDEDMKFKEI